MSDVREYECEYYKVKAHRRSCFFCGNCADIFFDYSNGPYMFLCDAGMDVSKGLKGECVQFIDSEQ